MSLQVRSTEVSFRVIVRREFAIGFAASISYFVALLLLPAIFLFNALILLVLAYFAGGAIVAALVVGLPLASRDSARWAAG